MVKNRQKGITKGYRNDKKDVDLGVDIGQYHGQSQTRVQKKVLLTSVFGLRWFLALLWNSSIFAGTVSITAPSQHIYTCVHLVTAYTKCTQTSKIIP